MVAKKLNMNQPILSVRRRSLMMRSQTVDETKIGNALPVIRRLHPQRSEPKSGPVRNAGAVPFQWEQKPGQPKEQIKLKNEDSDNKIDAVPQTGLYADEDIENHERSKQTDSKNSDSGDCDEAFVDGLDSLSRTESSLSSCSMRGLTGMDDLDVGSSRRFSMDPQTQEVKTDRLIPTSKATASEKPQYAPKRLSAVQELKKEIVNQDKAALWYRRSFAKSYSHYDRKEEKEESDDNRDQHENLIAICCLLPQSCLRSSVCILNPVPALSVRTRLTAVSANGIRSGSSSASLSTDTENEYIAKPVDRVQTGKFEENKTSLKNEIGQLESHNDLAHQGHLSFLEEKEVVGVPGDAKHAWVEGFGSHKKSFKTLEELLADEGSTIRLDSTSCVEKTVHVDTVHTMRSCPPNTEASGAPTSREDNNVIDIKRTEEMHILDPFREDFKKSNTVDFSIASSVDISDIIWGMKMCKASGGSENPNFNSTRKENMKVAEKRAAKNVEKQLSRATTIGYSHNKYSKFPDPPPLPRSPSDSWLSRTLPSMSTKKASTPSFISRCRSKS